MWTGYVVLLCGYAVWVLSVWVGAVGAQCPL